MVAGRGYVLPDDSLLIVAVADVYCRRRAARGRRRRRPTSTVPFDIRYAAGADPQRDAAIEALVDSLATDGTTVQ